MKLPKLLLAVSLLPFAFLAAMVAAFSVDVPWSDQWEFIPTLQASLCGQLRFADVWAPYVEHRLLFPRLLMLLLARLSDWNIRWELAAILLLALLSFTVFTIAVHRTSQRIGAGAAGWEIAACSLLFFSMSQKENWLFGWQLQMLLNQAAALTGFWLLARPDRTRLQLVLAILCGVVASYSFGNGLLCWVLGAAQILLDRRDSQRRPRLGAWLGCAALCIALHFHGQVKDHSAHLLDLLRHPLPYASYALAFLGAPLAQDRWYLAVPLGLAGLALCAALAQALARSADWRDLSFPLALAAYALGSAALAAIGRLSFDPGSALWSRYMTFSSLLWLTDLCLLGWLLRSGRMTRSHRRLCQIAAASILVLGLVQEARSTWAVLSIEYPDRQRAREAYLHDLNQTTEFVAPLSVVRERLPILKRLGVSLFRGTRSQQPDSRCAGPP